MRSLLVAILLLTVPCYGQDAGVDAPTATRLQNGSVLLNPPAFTKLDDELKRLQQVEREHKAEPPWVIPVLIGGAVGLALGAVAGASVATAVAMSQK